MKRFLSFFAFSLVFLAFLAPAGVHAQEKSAEEYHALHMELMELTRTGGADAAAKIAGYLNDPKLSTRALTALVNLPEQAGVPVMREALGTVKGECLAQVVMALGQVRDTESAPAIIALAEKNDDKKVRLAAILTLGKLATPACVETLKKLLTAEDDEIRWLAADAIFFACWVLGVKDEKNENAVTLPLYQAVRKAEVDIPTTMIATKNEFRITGDKALLMPLLASTDGTTLRTAQTMLAMHPTPEILAAVAAKIAEPDFPAVNRVALIRTLGVCGDESVVPALLKFAQDAADEETKIAAFGALADLKTPGALALFCDSLTVKNSEIPGIAARGLAEMKPETVAEPLKKMLRAPECETRIAALNVISAMRLAPLADAVKAAISDPEESVRVLAITTYPQLIEAQATAVEEMFALYAKTAPENSAVRDALKMAVSLLCRQTAKKAEVLAVLTKFYAAAPAEEKPSLLAFFSDLGGPEAAVVLGEAALNGETDTEMDEATKLLGQWTGRDADTVLYILAAQHPEEKYRIRTLRGYIRLIRQMGYAPLEKIVMCRAALAVAQREEEQKMIAEVLDPLLAAHPETRIFDGKTFDGWEGEEDIFRIQDETIIGGSMEKSLRHNRFKVTEAKYGDFYFRCDARLVGKGGNAGAQFRSVRMQNSTEMIGYQADMTEDGAFWGSLYDESRRSRMLVAANQELVRKIYKPGEFNRYEIVCFGNRVQLYVNGYKTADFTEDDKKIPATGHFGLQIHDGPPSEASYKNIYVIPLEGE